MVNYVESTFLELKSHPELGEKWLQKKIEERPSMLGLGDLVVRDLERRHSGAGRLDLLLGDPETGQRYEVEIQLGATDESHIIRTIEYYDIERRRYPQYEHCAVIVAENITSRFLNVIALFNGFIPIIAIQLRAVAIGDSVTLVATTVMNRMVLGTEDEDVALPTDRAYWESHGSPATVKLADAMLDLIREVDPKVELKYNKFYIGLATDGVPDNFVQLRPRKKQLIAEFRIPRSDDVSALIESAGVDALEYDGRWGKYRLRLDAADFRERDELLRDLIRRAHAEDES
jgi:predicted transport protein